MPTSSFRKWLARCAAGCLALAPSPPAGAKESVIPQAEVPAPVIATLKGQYPAARLLQFELEEEHGTRLYEIKVIDHGKTVELLYDPGGKLLVRQ